MNTQQTWNVTDIWKEVSNIGYTEYINVVDGTTRIVRWGHLQWISATTSLLVTGALVFAGIKFLVK